MQGRLGKWKDLYEGAINISLLYTLRAVDSLPALFAAHSTGDTDVPYANSSPYAIISSDKFVASIPEHDFDRNILIDLRY